MKNIRVISKIIILLFVILTMFSTTVNAIGWTDIINQGDKFLNLGKEQNADKNNEIINKTDLIIFNNNLYNIAFLLGVVLSVIIGAVLGIQIMMGSIEEQVKAKEALIPYVIGCLVIFGAFIIWKIIINMGENITGTGISRLLIQTKFLC